MKNQIIQEVFQLQVHKLFLFAHPGIGIRRFIQGYPNTYHTDKIGYFEKSYYTWTVSPELFKHKWKYSPCRLFYGWMANWDRIYSIVTKANFLYLLIHPDQYEKNVIAYRKSNEYAIDLLRLKELDGRENDMPVSNYVNIYRLEVIEMMALYNIDVDIYEFEHGTYYLIGYPVAQERFMKWRQMQPTQMHSPVELIPA